jgi:hypothetical protein
VTPRNPRRVFNDQERKSDAHAASADASLTLRDILLKVGEACAGGANGTFDFDLLGMSSTTFRYLSFSLAYLPILAASFGSDSKNNRCAPSIF